MNIKYDKSAATHRHVKGYGRRHEQSGAALLVAIVLVLISALLGISAMQDSGIENMLANNEKFQEQAFRTAEAASGSLLTEANFVALASNPTYIINTTHSIDTKVSISGELSSMGTGLSNGYSMGIGVGGSQTYKFSASGSAIINAVDSRSQVTQGMDRVAPAL